MPAFSPTHHLIRFASVAAGIAILVAPFRASAGLRGAMLVLAGLAVFFAYQRAGQLRQLLPPHKTLGLVVGAWILSASLWCFLSPLPLESLSVVKRDILTPVLAFLIFYALTRTRADIMRWLCVLVIGLFALTITVIRDPFDPLTNLWNSDYVTVGFLSTWMVTLAPLLALLLFAPRPWRRRAKALFVIALPCLLISAWLSGNRTVWVCFVGMVAVSMVLVTRGRFATGKQRRPVAVSLGLLAVLVSFLFGALQFRAQTQAPQDTGPLLFLLHDNRIPILHATNDMMAARPWMGYGYANPDIGDSFAARLHTPWLRQYVQHAHNVVLNHALQMGPTGAIVILALFATLAWVFIRRVPLVGLARLAGLCGVALIVGVFMRNMTDDFFSRHTAQFFGAALGMLLGLGTHRPPLNFRDMAQHKNT